MSVLSKVRALLGQITREEIEALPPAERQRLAQELKHMPKEGVLAHLCLGERGH